MNLSHIWRRSKLMRPQVKAFFSEWNRKLSEFSISYAQDGFVYNRRTDLTDRSASVHFKPELNQTIILHDGVNQYLCHIEIPYAQIILLFIVEFINKASDLQCLLYIFTMCNRVIERYNIYYVNNCNSLSSVYDWCHKCLLFFIQNTSATSYCS